MVICPAIVVGPGDAPNLAARAGSAIAAAKGVVAPVTSPKAVPGSIVRLTVSVPATLRVSKVYDAGTASRASPRPTPISVAATCPPSLKMLAASSPRNPSVCPLAGGNGPLNLPVAGSRVGRVLSVSATSRPKKPGVTVEETTAFDAGLTGMIGLAARCDSRLAGPDTKEFTSNAVTE